MAPYYTNIVAMYYTNIVEIYYTILGHTTALSYALEHLTQIIFCAGFTEEKTLRKQSCR